MEILLSRSLEALLLPPGGPLLLAALGLLLHWRGSRLGLRLTSAALALLFLFTLPPVARALLHGLEDYPALTIEQARTRGASAIVILGGGRYDAAPEYGGDTLSGHSLERVRYGALLQRHTGLPVWVSGGAPLGEERAEAGLMAQVLHAEYGVTEVYEESGSRTTAENARLLAVQLQQRGVQEILLVTHAWHMPRSILAFAGSGIQVHPAPTGFATTNVSAPWLFNLLPSAPALRDCRLALHEYLGLLWYRITN